MLADGEIDFDLEDGFDYLPMIDAGKSLTLLSGVHTGCFELRAHDSIHRVTDLRGKKVGIGGIGGADHLFVSAIAAYVGLDPVTDIEWVADPSVSQADRFAKGEIDAFVGFPPNPRQPCPRNAGHTLVNMAKDPPWSHYFCCMVATNADFLRNNPVAAKRGLRAILRATDTCHKEPERAARRMEERGFSYECALMTLNDARYGLWRDYDPADAVHFFTLRLHEAGMIKVTPNEVLSGYTDWRFLAELKRELA
jgi:NitT/TauT family transport system substrate-binding protein